MIESLIQLHDYFHVLASDDIRIKGTRISIEEILYEYLYNHQSPEEIQKHFTTVTLEQIYATILYYFRKSQRPESPVVEVVEEERYYASKSTFRIWFDLILSGVAILFAAESMVKSMEAFSNLTHIPFVVTGIMAGLIGCFGEMIVVHNFSIHPKGRIGDAVTAVAMDNIVTTLGAAIVAIMGGIFLGSNSLILIFIIILASNTVLIGQISKLKNSLTFKK